MPRLARLIPAFLLVLTLAVPTSAAVTFKVPNHASIRLLPKDADTSSSIRILPKVLQVRTGSLSELALMNLKTHAKDLATKQPVVVMARDFEVLFLPQNLSAGDRATRISLVDNGKPAEYLTLTERTVQRLDHLLTDRNFVGAHEALARAFDQAYPTTEGWKIFLSKEKESFILDLQKQGGQRLGRDPPHSIQLAEADPLRAKNIWKRLTQPIHFYSPESPKGKIVSDRTGVDSKNISLIKDLGAQGKEKSCSQHALTACARATGVPLRLETVKRTSTSILKPIHTRELKDIQKDLFKAAKSGDRERVSDLREREDDVLGALLDPYQYGLTKEQVLKIARALGLKPVDLDLRGSVQQALARVITRLGHLRRFMDLSLKLRHRIEKYLRKGYAVQVGYHQGIIGHSIALLEMGRNKEGRKTAHVFDPDPGRIGAVPWNELWPYTAIAYPP